MRGKDLSGLAWQPMNDPNGMAAYEAFDSKGRGYYLVRNKHRPEMMFVVSNGLSVPPGWYTDKDGTIRRIS
ncbi:MAG: hypothetical protein PHC49_01420 [Desulfuromonadaceae bacterium]|nr:hypothetical protein [Desulfuromonadaceae bacterium]